MCKECNQNIRTELLITTEREYKSFLHEHQVWILESLRRIWKKENQKNTKHIICSWNMACHDQIFRARRALTCTILYIINALLAPNRQNLSWHNWNTGIGTFRILLWQERLGKDLKLGSLWEVKHESIMSAGQLVVQKWLI